MRHPLERRPPGSTLSFGRDTWKVRDLPPGHSSFRDRILPLPLSLSLTEVFLFKEWPTLKTSPRLLFVSGPKTTSSPLVTDKVGTGYTPTWLLVWWTLSPCRRHRDLHKPFRQSEGSTRTEGEGHSWDVESLQSSRPYPHDPVPLQRYGVGLDGGSERGHPSGEWYLHREVGLVEPVDAEGPTTLQSVPLDLILSSCWVTWCLNFLLVRKVWVTWSSFNISDCDGSLLLVTAESTRRPSPAPSRSKSDFEFVSPPGRNILLCFNPSQNLPRTHSSPELELICSRRVI